MDKGTLHGFWSGPTWGPTCGFMVMKFRVRPVNVAVCFPDLPA